MSLKFSLEKAPPVSNVKYGRLYNWFAISNVNFAPSGWHVPSNAELNTLISTAGGTSLAGGTLKETGIVYWDSPNTEATNTYNLSLRGSSDRNSVPR